VLIELKASHHNLKDAYDDKLRDYRDSIPHLFVPNGVIVLSNGVETKVGTITSGWEFVSEWKKINGEGEQGSVSLETVIRGMCSKDGLLDIIENFVAFQDLPSGFARLLARNHQYLGVNNALARMEELRHAPPEERGKLGVSWHAQGSGKTMSMLFFSQKVLRKLAGNWSFVIVTDREDLDEQAYKEFVYAGAITEKHQSCWHARLRLALPAMPSPWRTIADQPCTVRGDLRPVCEDPRRVAGQS
jgi:type I restriction enzyme R subunit